MDFEYTTSGEIDIFGCMEVLANYNWTQSHVIGDIVYSKPDALKGLLRKHCIKEVRTTPTLSTLNLWQQYPTYRSYHDTSENDFNINGVVFNQLSENHTPLYVDTFNAYYNEEDLIEYEEALELVETYNNWHHEKSIETAKNC